MLYIVAVPLGNLEDITLRAIKVLTEADYILAEDTRKAGLLLKRCNIPKKQFISFYDHNEKKRIPRLLDDLRQGKNIALISRAGTPLVSDPGFNLVRKCIEEGIAFVSVPGACSVINALVVSGLGTDSFLFLGFLPRKKGKRKRKLDSIKQLSCSIVFFESPYRLATTLSEAADILGDRKCCVAREMTKLHEEAIRGSLGELSKEFLIKPPKGECTVVVEGFD